MNAKLKAVRCWLRLWFLGRELSVSMTKNETARANLDRAIRDSLQR